MKRKIIAVTACATGVAHTYMAAQALKKASKKMGHLIKVETQGATGIVNYKGCTNCRSSNICSRY